jgi:putative transposase
MRPARVLKSAIVLKPSTLLRFHKVLVERKYRALFSSKHRRRRRPKGPARELVNAVVAHSKRKSAGSNPPIRE